ncbi:phenylacetate--CoA ligase family protein [Bacteroides uniformis]|uniref:phenylacetate--CoA ligase family protein n=1 Tax=Bacteroides uniformis TaxID=820 RepID=UPI00216562A3|nr:phenylacetate--CoA ligase family protein [Bacteroides uniformis]MCS2724521.1 phenylacetate--CoA ligase family protein [Bacteroides uniformis]
MNIKDYLYETAKYALRSYPIIRTYIKEVERLYAMNSEELNQRNEKRFLEIFRRAYDNSPFYHQLYMEAGIRKEDVTCLADIKKLPIITKNMIRKNTENILTIPQRKALNGFTSGTTGTPLKVYKDWETVWRGQAFLYVVRSKYGFKYGQPFVSLRGNLNKNDTMLKVHASNTLFFSSYNINPSKVQFYYEQIVKHKPVAIEGYPNSLYALALLFRDAGLKLHIPLAFTSSETLLDYQRELIQEQLGAETYDFYGMTEQTICLAEKTNHNGYYEVPGYSINEFLEDGEICTSLINKAFPLIRYRSNDVIEVNDDDEYGVKIERILGRMDDYLIGKNGELCQRLNQIAKKAHHSKAMQMIQTEKGKVKIFIVPDGEFTKDDENRFIRAFEELVGVGTLDYSINTVPDIKDLSYSKRGKFKLIINKIHS